MFCYLSIIQGLPESLVVKRGGCAVTIEMLCVASRNVMRGRKSMKIARVFPRKTRLSPTDSLAYYDVPGCFDEADEVHVSTLFTWDMGRADYLAERHYWRVARDVVFNARIFCINRPGEGILNERQYKTKWVLPSRNYY
jgi:hypothetical protein